MVSRDKLWFWNAIQIEPIRNKLCQLTGAKSIELSVYNPGRPRYQLQFMDENKQIKFTLPRHGHWTYRDFNNYVSGILDLLDEME